MGARGRERARGAPLRIPERHRRRRGGVLARRALRRLACGQPTYWDLWLLRLSGGGSDTRDTRERTATPLLQTSFDELAPRVSPTGRWLAYVSNETGQFEVYVRAFPGPGGRVQVSSDGGTEPAWAPDGRRLYYRSGGRFLAATLATAPALAVTRRDTLFEDRSAADIYHAEYDVLPDGKHFVVLRPAAESPEIVVVLNWLTELRARMNASGERSR